MIDINWKIFCAAISSAVLIKLGSGILLGGLGTFCLGERLGFDWLFGDLAITAIVTVYCGIAAIVLWWIKRDFSQQICRI